MALDELVALGALGTAEAMEVARDILGANAASLYGPPSGDGIASAVPVR